MANRGNPNHDKRGRFASEPYGSPAYEKAYGETVVKAANSYVKKTGDVNLTNDKAYIAHVNKHLVRTGLAGEHRAAENRAAEAHKKTKLYRAKEIAKTVVKAAVAVAPFAIAAAPYIIAANRPRSSPGPKWSPTPAHRRGDLNGPAVGPLAHKAMSSNLSNHGKNVRSHMIDQAIKDSATRRTEMNKVHNAVHKAVKDQIATYRTGPKLNAQFPKVKK